MTNILDVTILVSVFSMSWMLTDKNSHLNWCHDVLSVWNTARQCNWSCPAGQEAGLHLLRKWGLLGAGKAQDRHPSSSISRVIEFYCLVFGCLLSGNPCSSSISILVQSFDPVCAEKTIFSPPLGDTRPNLSPVTRPVIQSASCQ